MPASFKVRTVQLEGRDGEFEDVLDPDFGESAIGRVAPVDSGMANMLYNWNSFCNPNQYALYLNCLNMH